jgi:hypothetical protein
MCAGPFAQWINTDGEVHVGKILSGKKIMAALISTVADVMDWIVLRHGRCDVCVCVCVCHGVKGDDAERLYRFRREYGGSVGVAHRGSREFSLNDEL